jgi:hypothetical protein
MIQQRSAELKLKTFEEKAEREKRTISAQSTARLDQIEQESSARLTHKLETERNLITEFLQTVHPITPIAIKEPSLAAFVRALQAWFEENRERIEVYEQTVLDIMKVRQLLGLSPSEAIHQRIATILAEKKRLAKELQERDHIVKEQQESYDELCKGVSRFVDEVAALRQWETWARRVHRIVYETLTSAYSDEQLRMSLEESLLSSVSNRKIMNKLSMLREQKKALVLVDKDVLVKRTELRPSLRSVIAVTLSCLRLEKLSGCLKIEQMGCPKVVKRKRMETGPKGTLFPRD